MEYCPCQTSGHFCMDCERELLEDMKRDEQRKALEDKRQKQIFMMDSLMHLIRIERTVEQMIKLGYLNRELFKKCYEEEVAED